MQPPSCPLQSSEEVSFLEITHMQSWRERVGQVKDYFKDKTAEIRTRRVEQVRDYFKNKTAEFRARRKTSVPSSTSPSPKSKSSFTPQLPSPSSGTYRINWAKHYLVLHSQPTIHSKNTPTLNLLHKSFEKCSNTVNNGDNNSRYK